MATPNQRGSALLGWLFLAVVFGPMILVGVFWLLAAMTGGSGADGVSSTRDLFMRLMIWTLLASGIAAVVVFIIAGMRRLARRRPEAQWRR